MMDPVGRRAKQAARCMRCRMHVDRCVCDAVPTLPTRSRVVVVMHKREWPKTTATSHLAALALPALEIRLRGVPGAPLDTRGLDDPERRTWLLFPSDDAALLTPALVAADPRPVTLVVPDGSWRQASKVAKREPGLRDLPRVRLPDLGPSRYRLRAEPRADGLATFEAISRALGILEGPKDGPRVRRALDALFDLMVRRTLESRGTPWHIPT